MPVSEQPDEELRTLAAADAAGGGTAQANLALIGVLLDVEAGSGGCPALFAVLRPVFDFDQALVLEVRGDELECTASVPGEWIGRRWPKGSLQTILSGGILVNGHTRDSKGFPVAAAGLFSADQPTLGLPIGIRGNPAALLLLRSLGKEPFGGNAIAVARECAVIALAALAARQGLRREAEIGRLHELVEQLKRNEQVARRGKRLIEELLDHLPIGVTVQDTSGRFILVNATAAANLATPADVLTGASPGDFLSDEEARQRRQWEIELMQSGRSMSAEENVNDGTGERTWLTSHMPVQICDQTLLLSSSLDITERKQFEQQLKRHAHFDELTGLPNRLYVQQCVEQLVQRKESGPRFALAFIDIDNFKHINDYYNHTVGDVLLVQIARKIRNRLRNTDILGRISGDEFLLIVDPVESDRQLHTLVNQVLDDLKQPFHIKAFEIFTSASIGMSVYPEHGTTYEALRRNADNAMYRAKREAKGDVVYFDSAMAQELTSRMEIEQRLRLAIRDHKFCCAFQPKVDITTQQVIGFETLVRWRDDDGEIHPPGDFIGLAIELGLIDPITNFVLDETVTSIPRLDDAFGPDTCISLNVAARQAGDLNFMRPFVEALRDSGYAQRLMLELTEDAFTAKSQFQTDVLPMLREIGVRVSIDDFGTGYSSLSVLADITADEVKVDRSFITDIHRRPRSQSVLRTIESLALALGMSIIAEGVETFEELAYLRAATRIRQAQGFYFSKPLYLDELTTTRSGDISGRALETTRERPARRSADPNRVNTLIQPRIA
jgi:diguanylate cyclase (GGDEF)-like protein/PAS domain S-box-containing protein